MTKGIGFNRRLQLNWLDAAAAFCAETDDPAEIRARLEPVVGRELAGQEACRKTVDILLNIWLKTAGIDQDLRRQALAWFQTSPEPADRLWLHYGLTLLYYSYFRECTTVIGQLSRSQPAITSRMVLNRLAARLGHIGSLERTLGHLMTSLRDWQILKPTPERYTYLPQRQAFRASRPELESWLLTCALKADPAEEIHFDDLLHRPALFPFRFSLTADILRHTPRLEVQRQGLGFDMVRLKHS
jgi:hypothetical protein